MVVDTKLYDILQLSPDAPEAEVKKQYKKLARQYHPDKAGPEFEEKFKEIQFANEVLSDPQKRDIYDKYGPRGLEEHGGAGGMEDILEHIFGGGGGGAGGMFGGGMFGGMGGFGPFGMMGGGGGGRRRPQRRRGEDMVHPLRVTLEDLFNGKLSKLKLKKKIICNACKGAGGKSGAVQSCTGCNGQGIKISIQPLGPGMVQQVQRVCPDCGGEGEQIDPKNRCKKCNGKKVCEDTKILEVQVDKGMKDNQKITFRGEGDQQPGVEPGDVIIVLQCAEHEKFERKGDDLYYKMDIGLTEALCGFKIPLQQLDKRELLVTNTPGKIIESGCTRCIFGEGMPMHRNPFERGNLFIKFNVLFPTTIDHDEDEMKKMEALLPPRPQMMIVDDDETIHMTLHDHIASANTYDQEGEDEEQGHGHGHGHPGGPGGVQCATQ